MICNFFFLMSTYAHDRRVKKIPLIKMEAFYCLNQVAFKGHFIIYFIYFQKVQIGPTSKTKIIIFPRRFPNLIDL